MALESAVRFANQKNHQTLSMKLVEMIQENENEEEDERDSDVELEELMTKKNADNLRQILKENDGMSTMISLPKLSTSKEHTTLKPKPLKTDKSPVQIKTQPEPEENSENDDDHIENDEVQCLKPKNLPKFSSKEINPFKIARQNYENNLKRKQIESDSE